MKTKFILSLCFFVMSALVAGAQSKDDIFKSGTQITWLGLDFSGARFIGDRERLGSESDVRHLIEALNRLIINEAAKYDIAKALGRTSVEKEIDVTSQHNLELEINEMFSDKPKDHLRLTRDDIQQIVSGYDFKGLSGIGLMFNVESLNKTANQANYYVTFVDMKTKQVLQTERVAGKPAGFGLRNFWAGSIHDVIEKIKKKEYELWRKKNS